MYRPQGAPSGLVGTWSSTTSNDLEGKQTTTIDLRADQTAHLVFDRTLDADSSHDGTWRAVGDDIQVT